MAKKQKSNPLDLTDFQADFRGLLDRMDKDPELVKDMTSEHKGNPITLGARVLSPEEWADKQVKRASDAADAWLEHVQKPRRDPIKAALAASAKRANKIREALEQKKWDKAMAGVDEDLMFEIIRKRGAAAFRAGIEDRKAKVSARTKELQPMVTALAKSIDAMPDATDADREKRLLAARRGMIEIGKKRRGI